MKVQHCSRTEKHCPVGHVPEAEKGNIQISVTYNLESLNIFYLPLIFIDNRWPKVSGYLSLSVLSVLIQP